MNLGALVSETRNPQTMDLDALSTLELVHRFNQQDTLVAQAVKETAVWYQAWLEGKDMEAFTDEQIRKYFTLQERK